MAFHSSTRTELAPDGAVVKHGAARVVMSKCERANPHLFLTRAQAAMRGHPEPGFVRVHTALAHAPEQHAFELTWQDRQVPASIEE